MRFAEASKANTFFVLLNAFRITQESTRGGVLGGRPYLGYTTNQPKPRFFCLRFSIFSGPRNGTPNAFDDAC